MVKSYWSAAGSDYIIPGAGRNGLDERRDAYHQGGSLALTNDTLSIASVAGASR